MVTNNNNFNGESKQIVITVVNVFNFHPPPEKVPATIEKKKSEFWKTKFLPNLYEVVKWFIKFTPLFFPLLLK